MEYHHYYRSDEGELQHYGVKGMKWGVRRKRSSHDDYQKAHSRKSVRDMSDAELRARNNRLQMEQQYAQLTRKKNRGKQIVTAIIAGAATLKALDGAYKTYKKYGDSALSKIGDWVVNSIDLTKPFA